MTKHENDKESAESKILATAKKLYLAKGMNGVSSRDIAEEAGINVALLNYYFRSKEKLQQIVFADIMGEFMKAMITVMDSDATVQQKIRVFIESEYEFLHKFPEIPNFIYSEMSTNGKCNMESVGFDPAIFSTKVFDQMAELQANGSMRQIELPSIMLLLLGNCHIPFLAKNMLCGIHSIPEDMYKQQIILHKQYVTEMLISYLFINQNNKTNV